MTSLDSPAQLSVILPCHAGANLARSSVTALDTFLRGASLRWEVLVIDDGGNDFDTTPLPALPGVRLIRHARNLGKGAAVRTGMLAATGQVRICTDVDLPYDLELLIVLYRYIKRGFHLAIGDRTMPGSTYAAATSPGRRAISAVAARLIGTLVTGGFHDTQCGLKAIRGDVAQALFPLVAINGFAYDVEVLYLALKHHLDIKRVPVALRRNDTSSVRVLRDSARSVVDILGIKTRQLRGAYCSPGLLDIVAYEADVARREAIAQPR